MKYLIPLVMATLLGGCSDQSPPPAQPAPVQTAPTSAPSNPPPNQPPRECDPHGFTACPTK